MWSVQGLQELVDYELNKARGIGKATLAQSDVKKGADAEIESAAAGLSQVARNKKIGNLHWRGHHHHHHHRHHHRHRHHHHHHHHPKLLAIKR